MLTPIEIISLVFSVIVLVKILVVLLNRKAMAGTIKSALKHRDLLEVFAILVAVILGYYIFNAMNIVEVVAVICFASFLYGIAFYAIPEGIEEMYKAISNKKLSGWFWLSVVIWVVIALWTLYTIFA